MVGNILVAGLVVGEIALSTYTLNKLGAFDKIKDKVSGFKNKVKSEYYKGRYPKEYAEFMREHGQVSTV